DVEPYRTTLAAGLVPVSFGDVVLDDAWGFSILSADTIAAELARALSPQRVVFVSDVPGILETGADGRRRVVADVTDETVRALRPGSSAPDVTGGIRGKATSMREISAGGVDAGLISGLTDGALSRALRGEFVYGSWAKARPGSPAARCAGGRSRPLPPQGGARQGRPGGRRRGSLPVLERHPGPPQRTARGRLRRG